MEKMAVIASVIGAIVTIVFGIVTLLFARRRADKGLMTKMPAAAFPARMDYGLASEFVVSTGHRACEWWNKNLATKVFVEDEVEGVTIMVEEDKDTPLFEFYARTKFVAGKKTVLMIVNMNGVKKKPQNLFRVMCHELGHVLGLDHDDDPRSVMYGQTAKGLFVVTDKDLMLVKERVDGTVDSPHIR